MNKKRKGVINLSAAARISILLGLLLGMLAMANLAGAFNSPEEVKIIPPKIQDDDPQGEDPWALDGASVAMDNNSPDALGAVNTVTTVNAFGDNFLEAKNPNKNHGGEAELKIKDKSDDIKRAIVQFDLSQIPAGATINSATLTLQKKDGNQVSIDACRVTSEWVEEVSLDGKNYVSTWNNRTASGSTGVPWTTAGGDFSTTTPTCANTLVPNTKNSSVSWTVTSIVQEWFGGSPEPNNGFLLKAVNETADVGENKFESREGAVSPQLEIDWSCDPGTTASIGDFTWFDANGNGNYVPGEGDTAQAGVTVNLLDSSATTTIATTTSNGSGSYSFPCVTPGTYVLEFIEPFGRLLTTQGAASTPDPTTGLTPAFSVAGGDVLTNKDAGFKQNPDITATEPDGLFFGENDYQSYIKLGDSYDQNGLLLGAFFGQLEGPYLLVAFVGTEAMNDNVFDDKDASPNPTDYMASVGWGTTRDMKTLYNSEKLIDITLTCGGVELYQWTQSYLCKADELPENLSDPYVGPLLASNGGLQSTLAFFEPQGAESIYTFGLCGRDGGTVPPGYTAATSLAWNLNHTLWETDRTYVNTSGVTSSDATHWKSPTDPAASPGDPTDTPNAFNYPFFDSVNQWEWSMVYEMAFDISECTEPLTITANSIHNSPSKGGDDAFFEEFYYDYGDLPDTYGTLDASSGPHHNPLIIDGAYLGSFPDTEADGQPSVDALGDDQDFNDDEDGVTVIDPFICGETAKINVNIGSPGYLSGFIDFNNSGTLSSITVTAITGPGTLPGTPFVLGDTHFDTAGDYQLSIAVPAAGASCTGDPIAARFRITKESGEGGNSPTQVSPSVIPTGEVEDYLFGSESQPGAIGNYVWLDENSDGFQDAGEPGIANVTVQLKNSQGVVLETTITDAHGGYLFSGLPEGTYFVDVLESTLPSGMFQTPYNLPNADLGNQDHSGNGYQVVLSAGAENLTADFGYNYNPTDCVDDPSSTCQDNTGAIGDRVWIDADGDGVQDPEEAGLGGVEVCIYYDFTADGIIDGSDAVYTSAVDQNGATGTGCTTTETDGSYIFNNLPPGQYVVKVTTTPSGYTQTGDPDHFGADASTNPSQAGDNQTTTPIILGPGDVFLNADFGYQITNTADRGSIGDLVFFDADGDGIFNGSDYGIAGVTVVLALDSSNPGVIDAGEIIATTTTDANGAYLFPGLPLDTTYLVAVTDTDNVLGGLTPTIGPSGVTNGHSKAQPFSVSLNTGNKDDLRADFGYTAPNHDDGDGLIGDTVFLDYDNSGTPDPGEGIEGVTVNIYSGDCTTTDSSTFVASTTTDENGHYYFGDLNPTATYCVVVDTSTLPPGLTQTFDPDGTSDNQSSSDLNSVGPIDLTRDFGYQPENPGSIGDQIWIDTNADGEFQSGTESGIGGVTVDLYYDTNGNGQIDPGEPKIASTTTAGDGTYLFSNLPTANNGVGDPGSEYIVDVTDVAGVLTGMWHSLGTPGTNDQSQADPYGLSISIAAPDNLTADFGYYVKPGAIGNFVWQDTGPSSPGGQGTGENGLFDEDHTQAGINGVEVHLKIAYSDGSVINITTVTSNEPGTGNPGWYSFFNLLLDEDYNGSNPGDPTYVLSITTGPPSTPYTTQAAGGAPDADGIDMGTDNNSDIISGEKAFPPQGGVDNTNDFGFSSTPLAIRLLDFGANITNQVNLIWILLLTVSLGLLALGLITFRRRPVRS